MSEVKELEAKGLDSLPFYVNERFQHLYHETGELLVDRRAPAGNRVTLRMF